MSLIVLGPASLCGTARCCGSQSRVWFLAAITSPHGLDPFFRSTRAPTAPSRLPSSAVRFDGQGRSWGYAGCRPLNYLRVPTLATGLRCCCSPGIIQQGQSATSRPPAEPTTLLCALAAAGSWRPVTVSAALAYTPPGSPSPGAARTRPTLTAILTLTTLAHNRSSRCTTAHCRGAGQNSGP